MSEEDFRVDIKAIPMPNKGDTQENPIEIDVEVTESWKRAQNALSQIGGRPKLLPTPQSSTTYDTTTFNFANFSGYPSNFNNNIPRIPNAISNPFLPPNHCNPPTQFYPQKPVNVHPNKTNSFRSFASRPFKPMNLPLQHPIPYNAKYRSKF